MKSVMRAVIVDDEPLAREAIRAMLADESDVEIVGEASSGTEAIDVVRAQDPDLLFLDIQMPDLGGFGVLEALGDDMPGAVLFVTAHDDFALQAFEVHALDYVLKPFGRERMRAALARARAQIEGGRRLTARALPSKPTDSTPQALEDSAPSRLAIRTGSRVLLVNVSEIDWIGADGDYVRVHTREKDHLLSARMTELEERLAPAGFLRVHRSSIINVERAAEFERNPEGGGAVILDSGVRLRVSESRWADFLEALGLPG